MKACVNKAVNTHHASSKIQRHTLVGSLEGRLVELQETEIWPVRQQLHAGRELEAKTRDLQPGSVQRYGFELCERCKAPAGVKYAERPGFRPGRSKASGSPMNKQEKVRAKHKSWTSLSLSRSQ